MHNKKGSLFIVTGPSGAGKGTVLGSLQKAIDRVFYSISATTRAPRPGETDGVNYYFVTRERFQEMIAAGELLEHAEYVGNYYGTPEGPVNAMLEQGMDVILEIEVQGALIVKAKRPDAHLIFIAPPSFEVLENRLRGRGTEAPEVVSKRLEKARGECARMEDYDYIVVNDTLDEAVQDLAAILRASRCRSDLVDFQLV
ncbi:MAG: guanylate kinase [Clostridia bacterium]|nr:guanylate kinase [Clostridia bacterium]